jgi:SynChlorMet cassette radical SAM/SPASM protein ScmF
MRVNVDQAEAAVRLAEELGAASLKFNIVQPTARGEKLHQADEALSIEELIALGRRVDMELSTTTPLRLFFDYPLAFRPLSRMARGDGCGICGIFGILGVIPTGHYALCGIGEQVPELVFGAVGEDPLETIWRENEVLNAIRAGLPEDLGGVCADCLMKHLCLGSCIAQNYYRSGDLFAPFWFCELAEKAGLFPRSRMKEEG